MKPMTKQILSTVALALTIGFTVVDSVEARGGGRGGGGGGGRGGAGFSGGGNFGGGSSFSGGGNRASTGNRDFGGNDGSRDFNGSDARVSDSRSGSFDSVNANRDVNSNREFNSNRNTNIDVDVDGGWHGGYGGVHHPVAAGAVIAGAAVVTAAAIGSVVYTVPTGCYPVAYGGVYYQQCGASWYMPQGSQYIVVAPPY